MVVVVVGNDYLKNHVDDQFEVKIVMVNQHNKNQMVEQLDHLRFVNNYELYQQQN